MEEQFGGFPVCDDVACVCSQWTIGTGPVCGGCMHLHHELLTRSC